MNFIVSSLVQRVSLVLEHQFSNLERTSPPTPLLRGYGVHTSREILSETWFRRPSSKIRGINRVSSCLQFGDLSATKELKSLRSILVCTR
jgi:hypothetical protein